MTQPETRPSDDNEMCSGCGGSLESPYPFTRLICRGCGYIRLKASGRVVNHGAVVERLRAENDALRTALEKIDEGTMTTDRGQTFFANTLHMQRIARAALASVAPEENDPPEEAKA